MPSIQATPDMAVSGQEAFETLRSVSYSELELPTSKKADGFTETQHDPHAIAGVVMEPAKHFPQGCKWQRSLSGPQYKLLFLPSEDISLGSSILFYNKSPLILDVDSCSHFLYI